MRTPVFGHPLCLASDCVYQFQTGMDSGECESSSLIFYMETDLKEYLGIVVDDERTVSERGSFEF